MTLCCQTTFLPELLNEFGVLFVKALACGRQSLDPDHSRLQLLKLQESVTA